MSYRKILDWDGILSSIGTPKDGLFKFSVYVNNLTPFYDMRYLHLSNNFSVHEEQRSANRAVFLYMNSYTIDRIHIQIHKYLVHSKNYPVS